MREHPVHLQVGSGAAESDGGDCCRNDDPQAHTSGAKFLRVHRAWEWPQRDAGGALTDGWLDLLLSVAPLATAAVRPASRAGSLAQLVESPRPVQGVTIAPSISHM